MTIDHVALWMTLGGSLLSVILLALNRFARFSDRTLDDVVEFLIDPEHERSREVFDSAVEQELRFLKVKRNFRRTQRRRLDLARRYFRTMLHDMRVVVDWANTEWNDMLYLHAEDEYDVETRELIDAIHLLDLTMAALTRDAGVHVARVREVHVLGHLVNAQPRHRLPRAAFVVVHQLLDLGALERRMDALDCRTLCADERMTAHTRADGGHTGIRRLVRSVVAVETVHAEPLHVHRVREVDRLLWLAALR